MTLRYKLNAVKEVTEEESRASTDQRANRDLLMIWSLRGFSLQRCTVLEAKSLWTQTPARGRKERLKFWGCKQRHCGKLFYHLALHFDKGWTESIRRLLKFCFLFFKLRIVPCNCCQILLLLPALYYHYFYSSYWGWDNTLIFRFLFKQHHPCTAHKSGRHTLKCTLWSKTNIFSCSWCLQNIVNKIKCLAKLNIAPENYTQH